MFVVILSTNSLKCLAVFVNATLSPSVLLACVIVWPTANPIGILKVLSVPESAVKIVTVPAPPVTAMLTFCVISSYVNVPNVLKLVFEISLLHPFK